jgi:Immunoglobulin I-set domain
VAASNPLKKPEITKQPDPVDVCDNHWAMFEAKASGKPWPTVQWEVSSAAGAPWIPETSATHTVLSFRAGEDQHGHRYRAVFTNRLGSARTDPVVLTVNSPPRIDRHPLRAEKEVGQTATFTAKATGRPPPDVQWEVSPAGGPWVSVPATTRVEVDATADATSTRLKVDVTAAENGNRYRAQFSNQCDQHGAATTETSQAATLSVAPLPAGLADNERAFHLLFSRLVDATKPAGTDEQTEQLPTSPPDEARSVEAVVDDAETETDRLLQVASELEQRFGDRPDVVDRLESIRSELTDNKRLLAAARQGVIDTTLFGEIQASLAQSIQHRLKAVPHFAEAYPPPSAVTREGFGGPQFRLSGTSRNGGGVPIRRREEKHEVEGDVQ